MKKILFLLLVFPIISFSQNRIGEKYSELQKEFSGSEVVTLKIDSINSERYVEITNTTSKIIYYFDSNLICFRSQIFVQNNDLAKITIDSLSSIAKKISDNMWIFQKKNTVPIIISYFGEIKDKGYLFDCVSLEM